MPDNSEYNQQSLDEVKRSGAYQRRQARGSTLPDSAGNPTLPWLPSRMTRRDGSSFPVDSVYDVYGRPIAPVRRHPPSQTRTATNPAPSGVDVAGARRPQDLPAYTNATPTRQTQTDPNGIMPGGPFGSGHAASVADGFRPVRYNYPENVLPGPNYFRAPVLDQHPEKSGLGSCIPSCNEQCPHMRQGYK